MRKSLRDLIMDENKMNDNQFEVVEGSDTNYNISEVKDNFLIDSHDLNLPENNKNIFVPKGVPSPMVKKTVEPPVNIPKNEAPLKASQSKPAKVDEPPQVKTQPNPKAGADIDQLLDSITVDMDDDISDSSLDNNDIIPEAVKPIEDTELPSIEEITSPKNAAKNDEPNVIDSLQTQDNIQPPPPPPPPRDEEEFDENGIDNLLNSLFSNNDTNNND